MNATTFLRILRILASLVIVTGLMTGLSRSQALAAPENLAVSHQWSKRFGDIHADYGLSIVVEPSGDAIVAGAFQGTADFGGGPLTSAGWDDIFLARYDSTGSHLWSRRFGGTGIDQVTSIATDSSGNIFMTGMFWDAIDLGGGVLSGSLYDIFLSKYDASGNHLWSKRFGGLGSDQGFGVATDALGNVFVTGAFTDGTIFGGGPLTNAGGRDIFLAKINANGDTVWSKGFGGEQTDQGSSVAIDGTGNVFVTGSFSGTANFGGGPLTSAGEGDIFLAKFDANGNYVWSKRFGGSSFDLGLSVVADDADHVVVTGGFQGTADFGGGPLTSAGGYDIFLARFDAVGNHQWSKRFGGTNSDIGQQVVVDQSGYILATGGFQDAVDFGGGLLTSAGDGDIFLARYEASGNHLWSWRFGGAALDEGYGVAAGSSDRVFVTGVFGSTVDFGGGPLTSAGAGDIFLAHFGKNHIWIPTIIKGY